MSVTWKPHVRRWAESNTARIDAQEQQTLEVFQSEPTTKIVRKAIEDFAPKLAKPFDAWLADTERFGPKYPDELEVLAFAGFSLWTQFACGIVMGWARARGLRGALELVVKATEVTVLPDRSLKKAKRELSPYWLQGLTTMTFTAAELAAVKKVLDVASLDPVARLYIAQITGDGAAIEAIAKRALEEEGFADELREIYLGPRTLLDSIADPSVFAALLGGTLLRELRYNGYPTLARGLERFGGDVMAKILVDVVPKLEKLGSTKGEIKNILLVGSCIDDERCARLLADRAKVKNLRPMVLEYFIDHPQYLALLKDEELSSAAKRKTNAQAPPAKKTSGKKAKGTTVNVPSVLVTPPWTQTSKRQRKEAPKVLAIPDLPAKHLRPGQFLNWVERARGGKEDEGSNEPLRGHCSNLRWVTAHMSDARLLERLLVDAEHIGWAQFQYLEGYMSRLGEAFVPTAVRIAAKKPAKLFEILLNVRSPRAAVGVAALLDKGKLAARARTWLLEHADVAVLGLAPATTDPSPRVRDSVEKALTFLRDAGKAKVVDAALQEIGAVPVATILPPKKLPKWASPKALPAPELVSGGVLPEDAVTNLLLLLTRPSVAAIADVKAACTRASLDAFLATLVGDWSLAGAPANDDWALFAAGHLGGDATARAIDERCAEWVKAGKVDAMQKALDVLAMIGTDVALSLLYERGLRARFADTQMRVRQLLEQVAAKRDIRYEDLEDHFVPELGLGRERVLDYGKRKFAVTLDERLRPVLMCSGERFTALPRPTKTDDAKKAKAANADLEQLKEDLERVATTQILRFERALREGRTWSVWTWRAGIVEHPLLRHLATRLVWDIDGKLGRVAEDGSLADADDEAFVPKRDATVRVAHPIDGQPKVWKKLAKVFYEYEILQPFPQLGREIVAKPLADTTFCLDYVGKRSSWTAVMDLMTGRGWRRTTPENGLVTSLEIELENGITADLEISPGLTIGRVKARPAQTIGKLELVGGTFGKLSAKTASEVMRDVLLLGE